jgi:hypothetical protein
LFIRAYGIWLADGLEGETVQPGIVADNIEVELAFDQERKIELGGQ